MPRARVMKRIGRIAALIAVAVIAMFLAMLMIWGSFVVAVGVSQGMSGRLGQIIGALIGTGLLLAVCLLTANAAIRMRGFVDRQRGVDRAQKLERFLDGLRADPLRAHWAPLAQQRHRFDPALIEQWERRYRELLADPLRRGWAALALEGKFPSNQEIDYQRDRSTLETCTHLQPLERELRSSDQSMRWLRPRSVQTRHALDGPRLIERYALYGVIWSVPEFDPRNPDPGSLWCERCDSFIGSGMHEPFPPD